MRYHRRLRTLALVPILLASLLNSSRASAADHDTTLVSFPGEISDRPSISASGRYVVFDGSDEGFDENSLDGPYGPNQVYRRDVLTGDVTLVSRASGIDGAPSNSASIRGLISGNGRFVSFTSSATNLSPDDHDEVTDIFVRDLQAHTTTLVSRADGPNGAPSQRLVFVVVNLRRWSIRSVALSCDESRARR